jgi:hypothetical protein
MYNRLLDNYCVRLAGMPIRDQLTEIDYYLQVKVKRHQEVLHMAAAARND